MDQILEVKDLHTYFYTDEAVAYAVEGVWFDVLRGQTLALVGESGCGKTVTALSIMRLVPHPTGRIIKGEVRFQGQDLLKLPEIQMRSIRGQHIAMVFQEPMSSLNPLYTIGYQIQEGLLAHNKRISTDQAKDQVVQLLDKVEIPSPKQRYRDYPHNLSGGLRQRAMIAQALACSPSLLIADEPTTALDVTIQAQILQLFTRLKETVDMSILLITHDLGIVAEVADRVCVMYAGRIVEEADVLTIFTRAKHPYTEKLLALIPARSQSRKRLSAIPGVVPNPQDKPQGCPFHPRCDKALERCRIKAPSLLEVEKGHKVSCWKTE